MTQQPLNLQIRTRTQFDQIAFYCDFEHNGKKYYADIVHAPQVEDRWEHMRPFKSECMIFKYKEDGEVDWSGEYCRRDLPVTEQSLTECIEEFIATLWEGE